MVGRLKRFICFFLVFIISLSFFTAYAQNADSDLQFSDVPAGHWAEKVILEARQKDITQGMADNKFGLGLPLKRSEFVKFLVSILGFGLENPTVGSFYDNQDLSAWYFKYIETAVSHGIVSRETGSFRPNDNITREEMTVMIVKGLGYAALARQLDSLGKPFSDVENNLGYVTIAKDLGIVSGKGENLFAPYESAKREDGIAMLMRLYKKRYSSFDELHAFYAISSYSQKKLIPSLSSVSFGWSRLEYEPSSKGVILNTTNKNGNDFFIPENFSEPVSIAKNALEKVQLNVFASQETLLPDGETGLVEYIITHPEIRQSVIQSICSQLSSSERDKQKVDFDGVVIDFECLKGETLRRDFTSFLSELKQKLDLLHKRLVVAVHPKQKPGLAYYDGYDYKAIGSIADRVILMAHDYNVKKLTQPEMELGYTNTPLTPFDEIYYALKAATDKNSGIGDVRKLWLQLSFGSAQWKMKNGKIINSIPYSPDYQLIFNRLSSKDTTQPVSVKYPEEIKNPCLTYSNTSDNTDNVIWYEDERSVADKLVLAKLFGVSGISLWRLGTIPDDSIDSTSSHNLNALQVILEHTKLDPAQ